GLATADLDGDGKPDFILVNQSLDFLSVIFSSRPNDPRTISDRTNGLEKPSAVAVGDLNGDGNLDLAVANSASNQILVFLGMGGGRFRAPLAFTVGTTPAGITITDLNGDHIPDLVVADEGSNDLAVLLGRGRGSSWTLVGGPRLQVGFGPVA